MQLNIQRPEKPTGCEAILCSQGSEIVTYPETTWGNLRLLSDLGTFQTGSEITVNLGANSCYFLGLLPFREIISEVTSYGQMMTPLLNTFMVPYCISISSRTFYSMTVHLDPAVPVTVTLDAPSSLVVHKSLPLASPALRLREISGLDIARLCKILGVSHTTYHKWIKGASPRGQRRDHLFQVLPLFEEAAKHFINPTTLGEWLYTPLSAAGSKPADYLVSKQYSIFLGFLLKKQSPGERIRHIGVPKRLVESELRDARQRLSPGPFEEDDE